MALVSGGSYNNTSTMMTARKRAATSVEWDKKPRFLTAAIYVVDKTKTMQRVSPKKAAEQLDEYIAEVEAALKANPDCDELDWLPRHVGRCTERTFGNLQHAGAFVLVNVVDGVGDLFIVRLVQGGPHGFVCFAVAGCFHDFCRLQNMAYAGDSLTTIQPRHMCADVYLQRLGPHVPHLTVPAGAAASNVAQKLVVVEIVCSSPSSLFVAVENAVDHMGNNPETQAFLIVVFWPLRRNGMSAMAAVDIGRVGGAVQVVQMISFGTADIGANVKKHALLTAAGAPAWVRIRPAPLPNLAVATDQPGCASTYDFTVPVPGAAGAAGARAPIMLRIGAARLAAPAALAVPVGIDIELSFLAKVWYRAL